MSNVKPPDIKNSNIAVVATTVGVILIGSLVWKRMKRRKAK